MSTIEQRIEHVVDSILRDYGQGRDIDKIELRQYPDKAVITDIIEKLLRIVYPGFFREKAFRMYNAKHHLSMLIEDVMYNLNREIRLVFQNEGAEDADEKAQEICLAFFDEIPGIRALVQTDVQAAYDGDPAATSKDEVIFCYPGLYAITVYRLAHV